MREMAISRGYVCFVDDEDFDGLSKWSWYAKPCPRAKVGERVYVVGYCPGTGDRGRMHRLLVAAPPDLHVDHIDGNPLNNQRANLRICLPRENACNYRVTNAASGFKGVHLDRIRDKRGSPKRWRASITSNRKKIELGRFATPAEAAVAYDTAALKYFGEFAATNADLGLLLRAPLELN